MGRRNLEFIRDSFHEHFIYYDTTFNSAKTRFAVAHELGHILLHQPHAQEEAKRRYIDLARLKSVIYVVEFSQEEEVEADTFASIIKNQESSIEHPLTLLLIHSSPIQPLNHTPSCLSGEKRHIKKWLFRDKLLGYKQ